jgi:quercetin dioxygenase-like cupin family protein
MTTTMTTATTTTPATPTPTVPTSLVRGPDEGDATWFFNALMTTKASTAETGGAYSLTEHLVTAASNPPLHVQTDEDEAFYILEGTVEFEVDGRTITATPGSFAFVARGAAHLFRVVTDTARMLVICSGKPADNLEYFFTHMGQPATERALPSPTAPDEARLAALCARTGIELV